MIRKKIIKSALPFLKHLIPLKMPEVIAIEASNRCLLKCVTCPIPTHMRRQKGEMSLSTFTALLNQITWKVEKLCWAFGGEPLINPEIWQMIKLASDAGIPSKVDTNGMLLRQYVDEVFSSNLHVLNVAFEGITPQSTENFRLGYDYNLVMDNIRLISEKRQKNKKRYPLLTLNFLVRKDNEDEMQETIGWARKLNVDRITLKSININPSVWLKDDFTQALASQFLPVKNIEFSRYIKKFGKWTARDELIDFCRYIHNSVTICWDGTVLPCCFDFDATMACGNVRTDNLKNIWRSKKFSDFRADIYRKSASLCKNCTSVSLQKIIPLALPRHGEKTKAR